MEHIVHDSNQIKLLKRDRRMFRVGADQEQDIQFVFRFVFAKLNSATVDNVHDL